MSAGLIDQKIISGGVLLKDVLLKDMPDQDSKKERQSTNSVQIVSIIPTNKVIKNYPKNHSNRVRFYFKYEITKLISKLQTLTNKYKLRIKYQDAQEMNKN